MRIQQQPLDGWAGAVGRVSASCRRGRTNRSDGTGECRYYSSGQCIVECSGDGKDWKELGRIGKVETKSFSLPKELSGQKDMWIRIRGSGADDPQGAGSFQVYGYTYSARLGQPVPDTIGRTHFVEILENNKEIIQVELLSCGSLLPDNNQIVRFRVKNISTEKQIDQRIDGIPKRV